MRRGHDDGTAPGRVARVPVHRLGGDLEALDLLVEGGAHADGVELAASFDPGEKAQLARFETIERAGLEGGGDAGIADGDGALGDLHAVLAEDPGVDLRVGGAGGGLFQVRADGLAVGGGVEEVHGDGAAFEPALAERVDGKGREEFEVDGAGDRAAAEAELRSRGVVVDAALRGGGVVDRAAQRPGDDTFADGDAAGGFLCGHRFTSRALYGGEGTPEPGA